MNNIIKKNQIISEYSDYDYSIVNFYRTKLFDIISTFFIKYFIKYTKPDKDIKDIKLFLLNIDSKINEIFSKFKLYIDKKYHINTNDLEIAFDIYIKEYIYSLLHTKIKHEKNDILYSFFKICCKKIAYDIYILYNTTPISTLSMSNLYILKFIKIINDITSHQLNDIIPLNIITSQYLMIEKIQEQKNNSIHNNNNLDNIDNLDYKSKSNNNSNKSESESKSKNESKNESESKSESESKGESESTQNVNEKSITSESDHEKIIHLPVQYRKYSDQKQTIN